MILPVLLSTINLLYMLPKLYQSLYSELNF